MKNLFESKTLWVLICLIFLGSGGDKKVLDILTTLSITPREAVELAATLAAMGGAGYARYQGDKDMYTPKCMSGRDKPMLDHPDDDEDDDDGDNDGDNPITNLIDDIWG